MIRKIVSVGTGRYEPGLARLRAGMSVTDPGSEQQFWTKLPDSWPAHSEKPYAFKAHALMQASTNADLLLWCDAAVIPVRSLEPLWERIERNGYWFAINGWTNYEWTADSAYADLFPGVPIEEAREMNKKFTQVVATAFGINARSRIGATFLAEYYRLANTRAFCGPWGNLNAENGPKYCDEMMGFCGPADVFGHRHDQTAASLLAYRLGMNLTECPEIFSYPPAADNTILLAVGA